MSRFIRVDWDELRWAWHRLKRRLTPRPLREAAAYTQAVGRFVVTQQKKRHRAELEAYAEFKPGSLGFDDYLILSMFRAEDEMAAALQQQIFGSKPLVEQLRGLRAL